MTQYVLLLVTDKYYIVDVGYLNTKGYIAPYKGMTLVMIYIIEVGAWAKLQKEKKRRLTTITSR